MLFQCIFYFYAGGFFFFKLWVPYLNHTRAQGPGAIIYFLYTLFCIISPLLLHGNENVLLIFMQKIFGVSGLKYPHTTGARWPGFLSDSRPGSGFQSGPDGLKTKPNFSLA